MRKALPYWIAGCATLVLAVGALWLRSAHRPPAPGPDTPSDPGLVVPAPPPAIEAAVRPFGFLAETHAPEAMGRYLFNAEKESILNRLESSDDPALMAQILDLIRDSRADLCGRDYAIQHLNPIYDRKAREPGWTESAEGIAARETLFAMLNERESTLAGTALLALRDLARRHPEFDRARIAAVAREIALDEQAGDLSRVTALRVCVEGGDRSLLELARRWAQSDRGLPLRIAGVAALGDAGEAEDLEWLRATLERAPRGLRPALHGAVKRFEVRLNAGSDRSSI